jgi:hypothetical protein
MSLHQKAIPKNIPTSFFTPTYRSTLADLYMKAGRRRRLFHFLGFFGLSQLGLLFAIHPETPE